MRVSRKKNPYAHPDMSATCMGGGNNDQADNHSLGSRVSSVRSSYEVITDPL